MKIYPLSILVEAAGQGQAAKIDEAEQVLVQNGNSTVRYIHLQPSGSVGYDVSDDNVIAVQGNKNVLVRKDHDEEIYATTDLAGDVAASGVYFTKAGASS